MALEIQVAGPHKITYITPRDFASVVFLHSRVVVWTFSLILGAAILFAIFQRPVYRSQMTILMNLERTDPVVTTDANLTQRTATGISDQEVNSELELLKSQDLLRDVVIACDLQSVNNPSRLNRFQNWLGTFLGRKPPDPEVNIAKAALELRSNLSVELIPKSTLIRLSYASPERERSTKVLSVFSDLYMKKHLAVRRPVGTFDFFKREAEEYHRQLLEGEQTIERFTRENNLASVELEKDAALKKLTELQMAHNEAIASIAVASQRIRTVEAQMAQLPSRQTTQVRTGAGRSLEQAQSTLLGLELKRSELLGIFQPDYPAVKQVERQIAEAQAAVSAAQVPTIVEQTTDRDPAYEWLKIELEKARVDLVALQSRDNAVLSMIAQFRNEAARLNKLDIQHTDLSRSVKLAEASYITFHKKQEEARISDALDRQRILNLAIADPPTVPVFPSKLPTSVVLLIGLFSAIVFSGGVAFAAEAINRSLRTPEDVEIFLNVPVVAAIPERVGVGPLHRGAASTEA
jgi:uncharacterized protein involved in exopolysaccharide biosynthesis